MNELQISFIYDCNLIKILLEACEESRAVLLTSRDLRRPKLNSCLQLLFYETEAFDFHSLLALESIVLQALSIDLRDIKRAKFCVQELIRVLYQVEYDIEIRPSLNQVLDHWQCLSEHVDILQPLVDLSYVALLPLELINFQHLRQVVSLQSLIMLSHALSLACNVSHVIFHAIKVAEGIREEFEVPLYVLH